jgi:hypothetical protein
VHGLAVELDALKACKGKPPFAHPYKVRLVQDLLAPDRTYAGIEARYLDRAPYPIVSNVDHLQHARRRRNLAEGMSRQVDASLSHLDNFALHAFTVCAYSSFAKISFNSVRY